MVKTIIARPMVDDNVTEPGTSGHYSDELENAATVAALSNFLKALDNKIKVENFYYTPNSDNPSDSYMTAVINEQSGKMAEKFIEQTEKTATNVLSSIEGIITNNDIELEKTDYFSANIIDDNVEKISDIFVGEAENLASNIYSSFESRLVDEDFNYTDHVYNHPPDHYLTTIINEQTGKITEDFVDQTEKTANSIYLTLVNKIENKNDEIDSPNNYFSPSIIHYQSENINNQYEFQSERMAWSIYFTVVNKLGGFLGCHYDYVDYIYGHPSDHYLSVIINKQANNIIETFDGRVEYTTNKVIDYATDVIITSVTHCDENNEHDDHAYRYLERNNIITERFNNNVTEMITKIKSIIPRDHAHHHDLVISNDKLHSLYNSFIRPYHEKGPYTLPPMNIFNLAFSYITRLIDNGNEDNILLKSFRDMLSIMLSGRNVYFENIKVTNEIVATKKNYSISIDIIRDLREQLSQHYGSGSNGFDGSLGITIKQPKSLLYAQALIDLYMAWYVYLFGTSNIETGKYLATVEYVKLIGTREEAYNMLTGLLDERFKNVEDDIKIGDTSSSSGYTSSTGSLSDGKTGDLSSSSGYTSSTGSSSGYPSCADSSDDGHKTGKHDKHTHKRRKRHKHHKHTKKCHERERDKHTSHVYMKAAIVLGGGMNIDMKTVINYCKTSKKKPNKHNHNRTHKSGK